jgi:hypothetical protein
MKRLLIATILIRAVGTKRQLDVHDGPELRPHRGGRMSAAPRTIDGRAL